MDPADPDSGRGTAVAAVEVQVAIMARNTELLRRRGATAEELDRAGYLILRALELLGTVDINGLSTVLGLDASTAGRQVGRLVDDGLALRRPADEDRRHVVLSLSDEGRRRLELTIAARRGRIAELLAGWGREELTRFGELLERYNATVADRYMTGRTNLRPEQHGSNVGRAREHSS